MVVNGSVHVLIFVTGEGRYYSLVEVVRSRHFFFFWRRIKIFWEEKIIFIGRKQIFVASNFCGNIKIIFSIVQFSILIIFVVIGIFNFGM